VTAINEFIAQHANYETQQGADHETQECDSALLGCELVDDGEDVREGNEEGVHCREAERDVDGEECNDGLNEEHVKGPCEGDHNEELESCGASGAGGWEDDSSLLAAVGEDGLFVGFPGADDKHVGESGEK